MLNGELKFQSLKDYQKQTPEKVAITQLYLIFSAWDFLVYTYMKDLMLLDNNYQNDYTNSSTK